MRRDAGKARAGAHVTGRLGGFGRERGRKARAGAHVTGRLGGFGRERGRKARAGTHVTGRLGILGKEKGQRGRPRDWETRSFWKGKRESPARAPSAS